MANLYGIAPLREECENFIMTSLSLKYQLRLVKQLELLKLEVGSGCNVLVIYEV